MNAGLKKIDIHKNVAIKMCAGWFFLVILLAMVIGCAQNDISPTANKKQDENLMEFVTSLGYLPEKIKVTPEGLQVSSGLLFSNEQYENGYYASIADELREWRGYEEITSELQNTAPASEVTKSAPVIAAEIPVYQFDDKKYLNKSLQNKVNSMLASGGVFWKSPGYGKIKIGYVKALNAAITPAITSLEEQYYLRDPLMRAVEEYNALNLSMKMEYTESNPDIQIYFVQSIGSATAMGTFPSTPGKPGATIIYSVETMRGGYQSWPNGINHYHNELFHMQVALHIHEIGHNLGLAHTDELNSNIAGTPNRDPLSVMNTYGAMLYNPWDPARVLPDYATRCKFSRSDILALKNLFPVSVAYPQALFDMTMPSGLVSMKGYPLDTNVTIHEWEYLYSGAPGAYGDAAVSGRIGHSQQSQMSMVVNTTSGERNLGVRFNLSSEANYDYFLVYVDGGLAYKVSGVISNKVQWITLPANKTTCVVTMIYSKDGSVSSGLDRVSIEAANLVK